MTTTTMMTMTTTTATTTTTKRRKGDGSLFARICYFEMTVYHIIISLLGILKSFTSEKGTSARDLKNFVGRKEQEIKAVNINGSQMSVVFIRRKGKANFT